MKMIHRIVFDANVWISAVLNPQSFPADVIGLARDGWAQSILSPQIINQVSRHLARLEFTEEAIENAKVEMVDVSQVNNVETSLDVITEKPSGNRVLECAVDGKADFIVTGDRKHLLRLRATATS